MITKLKNWNLGIGLLFILWGLINTGQLAKVFFFLGAILTGISIILFYLENGTQKNESDTSEANGDTPQTERVE